MIENAMLATFLILAIIIVFFTAIGIGFNVIIDIIDEIKKRKK
jgi:Trk-type K+ transport system membrane component